jgi:hypothetical protein
MPAVVALVASCASLAGTKQVVSFDSSPRGVEVRNEDGQFLGQTPFFARIERERTHDLRLSRPFGPVRHHTLRCDFRWGGTGLANAVPGMLALASGPVGVGLTYAGALGVDLLTGAAFHCPDTVQLPSPPSPTDGPGVAEVDCPAYVVAPPHHEDGQLSRMLADAAADRLLRAKPCARRIDPAATDAIFRRHGVTHEKPFKADRYGRTRLNELGLRTGATHLVVLAVTDREQEIDAAPEIADLHTLHSQQAPPFVVDLRQDERAPRHPIRAFLGRHVQLLPNSLGFAPSVKAFTWEPRNGRTVVGDRPAPSRVPDLVGNWTLLSVDHPGGWEPWDVSLRLHPDIVFGWHARVLDTASKATDGTLYDRRTTPVQVVQSGLTYGLTGTLHTPAGAFSASLGLGGGFAWHWASGTYRDWDAGLYASAGAAWTVFASENVFLRLGVTSTGSGTPHAVGDDYGLVGWVVSSLTLGWYVPEWRSVVRGWF